MVAQNEKTMLGAGAYSVPQAARLVGANYSTLSSWIDVGCGVVPRYFDPERRALSFVELMELHFIKMFRDEGVSLQAIRLAAAKASKRFDTQYPFAVKRFDTDGRTIFATLAKESSDEELVEDLRRGQYVFKDIVRPFFRKLEYKNAEVSRFWPLGKRRRVVLDPRRRLGQPIDSESGIPTKVLFDATNAGDGQSVKEVSEWYGVSAAAVRRAVEFERSLQR